MFSSQWPRCSVLQCFHCRPPKIWERETSFFFILLFLFFLSYLISQFFPLFLLFSFSFFQFVSLPFFPSLPLFFSTFFRLVLFCPDVHQLTAMNSLLDPTNSLKHSRKFSSVGRIVANCRERQKKNHIIMIVFIIIQLQSSVQHLLFSPLTFRSSRQHSCQSWPWTPSTSLWRQPGKAPEGWWEMWVSS